MIWARIGRLFAVLGAIGAANVAVAQDPDADAWTRATEVNTRAAFEAYLAEHPTGRFARQAFAEIVVRDVADGLALSSFADNDDDGIY